MRPLELHVDNCEELLDHELRIKLTEHAKRKAGEVAGDQAFTEIIGLPPVNTPWEESCWPCPGEKRKNLRNYWSGVVWEHKRIFWEDAFKKASARAQRLVDVDVAPELEKIIDEVIVAWPREVAEFKGGKEKALNFLVGMVMRGAKGKADAGKVNRVLRKKISQVS